MSDISVISISWILSKIEFIFRICTHSQSEIVWRWILCGEINQRHHPLFTRKYFQKWHQQSTRNNKNEKQEEKKVENQRKSNTHGRLGPTHKNQLIFHVTFYPIIWLSELHLHASSQQHIAYCICIVPDWMCQLGPQRDCRDIFLSMINFIFVWNSMSFDYVVCIRST